MTYGLPNAWELAEQRLALLQACHDPLSIRRAEALGVGPGWRCLEVGAGGGSFARWLAERTGDALAVDIDVRHIEPAPGLEIRQLDLATDDLPRDAFDLVHTRLVLIHIPERDEILPRLIAALRPGGVLLLEEDDIFSLDATASAAYREGWAAFLQLMTSTDGEWARGLPERLLALGLADVESSVDVQFFPGGATPARFWSMTWQQKLDEAGALAGALERGQAALEETDRWFYGPAKVIAWGRRKA
jgi:SAM-dependent methyltransferase